MMSFGSGRSPSLAALVLLLAAAARAMAADDGYVVTDSYVMVRPEGAGVADLLVPGAGAAGGAVAGYANLGAKLNHACRWTPKGVVELDKLGEAGPGLPNASEAFAELDGVQVGWYRSKATDAKNVACRWEGTAASVFNLHPTNLAGYGGSRAVGMGHGQIVGDGAGTATKGNTRALLWTGGADTAVNLHPPRLEEYHESFAVATDGRRQVGYVHMSDRDRAVIWSGTAASAVDLHPRGPVGPRNSRAYGIDGDQVVGVTNPMGEIRAALWAKATPESYVNLHPTSLDRGVPAYHYSEATGTNGRQQVGYATTRRMDMHAMVWSGTSDSAVDLHASLGKEFTTSRAYTIDAEGNVYGTARGAKYELYAVRWTPR
jgi:hypothetical protein